MNTELLPCPFCGGEAEMEFNEESVTVFCKTCESEIKRGNEIMFPAHRCIKAWNRRVEKPSETFEGCKGCIHHYYDVDKDKNYCEQYGWNINHKLVGEIKDMEKGCANRCETINEMRMKEMKW